MNTSIRRFKSEDALETVRLNNRVWRVAYKGIFPDEVFDDRDAKENERAKKIIEEPQNDEMFVAEVDGKIAGMMYLVYESKVEFFKEKGFGELTVLYVDNEFQRAGIGRKLFEKAISLFAAKGLKNFAVGALEDNKIGRSAYEKWGGVLSSYKGSFEKNGNKYSEIYYEYEV